MKSIPWNVLPPRPSWVDKPLEEAQGAVDDVGPGLRSLGNRMPPHLNQLAHPSHESHRLEPRAEPRYLGASLELTGRSSEQAPWSWAPTL